jgi:hypothetical protein
MRGKSVLKITEIGGATYTINEKRQKLWGLFQNARRGEPILTTFDVYNNIEYISDARPITDEILKNAVSKLGEKLADQQTAERLRSQSLSYSKDLVVAGKLSLEDLYEMADKGYRFIKEGWVKELL